jgi:hypothetical protein
MATPSTTTTSYPKIGLAAWAKLRAKAAAAPSTKFTPSAVAALLGLGSPSSAATNVVGPMQRLGLIDENGALTDLGNSWRNGGTYAEACQEIVDTVYPDELAVFTDSSGAPSRAQVTKWFQQQKFGESNARQMAATYAMIAEKKLPDVTEKDQTAKPRGARPKADPAPRSTKPSNTKALKQETAAAPPVSAIRPDVHFDIQIHIAADASADQIEQIFASMAKYLYQAT